MSAVPPYRDVCSEDTGQIMVDNSPAAWLEALGRMNDAGLREQLAARALTWAAARTIEATGRSSGPSPHPVRGLPSRQP